MVTTMTENSDSPSPIHRFTNSPSHSRSIVFTPTRSSSPHNPNTAVTSNNH
ncbi:hypothetical protein Hanom_Chr02g00169961 [Helianthus anomalus]